MDIKKYLDEMKNIQSLLLQYLDNDDDIEERFQKLNTFFNEIKIFDDQYKLKLILCLIVEIGNNRRRSSDFFGKIFRTMQLFEDSIKKYFTNSEIFHIFISNKRILLYAIEKELIKVEDDIVREMITTNKYIIAKYPEYFAEEVNRFKLKEWFPKKRQYGFKRSDWVGEINEQLPDNYKELRRIGENDTEICKLIRNDDIKDFIIYVNKNSISLTSRIKASIYETNMFLLKINDDENKIEEEEEEEENEEKKYAISLIEYAAFFGSIQIFNYLKLNDVELTSSLWLYAIHGQNPEIIHALEDCHVFPKDESYKKCFFESIKCHNNDIVNYLLNNHLSNKEISQDVINQFLKYYNFELLEDKHINESSLISLCAYDYYSFVNLLLVYNNIDINKNYKIGNNSKTLIYTAVEKDHLDIIKLLLTNENLDINIKNTNYKEKRIIDSWKDVTNSRTKNYETALFLAVEKENLEVIKLLLTNDKLDLNILNFYEYTKDGRESDYGTNNSYKKTAFYLAVEKENIEIVKLLLESGKVDLNILNDINESFIEETFGTIKEYRKTAFYLAVENNNIDFVKLLLSKDELDPNFLNEYTLNDRETGEVKENKKTALFLAVERNKIEIIELLLNNAKIDPNILNKIHIGHDEACDFDDWYWTNKSEKTALFLAVERNKIEIIELLLDNDKLNPNILNKIWEGKKKNYDDEEEEEENDTKQKTALHLAVENDRIDIIKLLLKHEKIDVNVEDKEGKKPIDYAKNTEIKTILKQ